MVSIIIPSYGQEQLLKLCISHLDFCRDKEIIVVDDGYGIDLKDVKVIKQANKGFAASVNEGIRQSKHETVAVINSDVLIYPGAIEQMIEALNVADLIGAKLYYPDGAVQHAGSIYSGNHQFCHDHSDRQSCYSLVTGALLVFTKSLIDKIGYFDEKFFIAYEDVDFCLRTLIAGLKVYYCAQAQAIHIEGATRGNDIASKTIKNQKAMIEEEKSKQYFKQKYSEEEIRRLCKLLVH